MFVLALFSKAPAKAEEATTPTTDITDAAVSNTDAAANTDVAMHGSSPDVDLNIQQQLNELAVDKASTGTAIEDTIAATIEHEEQLHDLPRTKINQIRTQFAELEGDMQHYREKRETALGVMSEANDAAEKVIKAANELTARFKNLNGRTNAASQPAINQEVLVETDGTGNKGSRLASASGQPAIKQEVLIVRTEDTDDDNTDRPPKKKRKLGRDEEEENLTMNGLQFGVDQAPEKTTKTSDDLTVRFQNLRHQANISSEQKIKPEQPQMKKRKLSVYVEKANSTKKSTESQLEGDPLISVQPVLMELKSKLLAKYEDENEAIAEKTNSRNLDFARMKTQVELVEKIQSKFEKALGEMQHELEDARKAGWRR